MKKLLLILIIMFGFVGCDLALATMSNQTAREPLATGDGVTTAFTFNFPIDRGSSGSHADLEVWLVITTTGVPTQQTETTHYAVSATNNNFTSGGTVTFVTAPAATEKVLLLRATPQTQNSDIGRAGVLRSIQNALDKLTRQVIDLQEEVNRTPKNPKTDAATLTTTYPSSVDRAGKNATFDANGNVTATDQLSMGSANVSAFGATLIDDANRFVAMVTLSGIGVYNIQTYGAIPGDGIDDYAAIVAAIAAAPAGSVVWAPVGNYLLSQTLVIAKKITLKGSGFKISNGATVFEWTQTDGTNGIETTASTPILIDGLDIKGNSSAGHGVYNPSGASKFYNMRSLLWGGDGLNATNLFICEFWNCSFQSNVGNGISLTTANENRFYSCDAASNAGTADVYLDDCIINLFDIDTGNGDSDWAIYITGESYGNQIRTFYDGGTDQFAFLDTNTDKNYILYSGSTISKVVDLGVGNDFQTVQRPLLSTKTHSEGAMAKTENIVHNPSGVVDIIDDWSNNDAANITHTRIATDGVSTGTAHKFAYLAAATGKEVITNKASSAVAGDLIVGQFWAKTSRTLTSTERAQCFLEEGNGKMSPLYVSAFHVTTDWKFFSFAAKATDTISTLYLEWEMTIANDVDLFVTDVSMVVNPGCRVNQVPYVFAGGLTEFVNFPISHTTRLDQTGRFVNLDTTPDEPEPGATAMADNMNWDPMLRGTSKSELVFYRQVILVGDDYKWTAGGGGTNEYYVELIGGGNPNLSQPDEVRIDGVAATEGSVDSLAAGQWDYADSDTLGYSTIYVRLASGVDPDDLKTIKVGTDTNDYKCIRDHTSGTINKPITGSNYLSFWQAISETGDAWVTAQSYTAGDGVITALRWEPYANPLNTTITDTIELSSANILALNGTPITLVEAQGADTLVEFLSAILIMDSTATAYDGVAAGEDLVIQYEDGDDVSQEIETTGFIDQTSDEIRRADSLATSDPSTDDLTDNKNDSVQLFLKADEIATGTGTMTVKITYRVHTLGL